MKVQPEPPSDTSLSLVEEEQLQQQPTDFDEVPMQQQIDKTAPIAAVKREPNRVHRRWPVHSASCWVY